MTWICLAIFMALSTASEPPEQRKIRFRSPGVIPESTSASWTAGRLVYVALDAYASSRAWRAIASPISARP